MPRREQIQTMLDAEPDDVFLNYALAKSLVEEGRVDEGIAQFRRTLQLDPDHVASYFQLAQVLAAEGNVDESRTVVTQGIAIARQVGDTHAEMEMTGFLDSL